MYVDCHRKFSLVILLIDVYPKQPLTEVTSTQVGEIWSSCCRGHEKLRCWRVRRAHALTQNDGSNIRRPTCLVTGWNLRRCWWPQCWKVKTSSNGSPSAPEKPSNTKRFSKRSKARIAEIKREMLESRYDASKAWTRISLSLSLSLCYNDASNVSLNFELISCTTFFRKCVWNLLISGKYSTLYYRKI